MHIKLHTQDYLNILAANFAWTEHQAEVNFACPRRHIIILASVDQPALVM